MIFDEKHFQTVLSWIWHCCYYATKKGLLDCDNGRKTLICFVLLTQVVVLMSHYLSRETFQISTCSHTDGGLC